MPVATVTSKGQVTLPAEIREEFDIQAGDTLVIFRDLDGEGRFRVRRRARLSLGPLAPFGGAPKTLADIDRSIGEAVAENLSPRDDERQ